MSMTLESYGSWHVTVVIPARNEEALLPRCLRSVLTAMNVLPVGVTTDIVVALDRCTDTSVNVAQRFLASRGDHHGRLHITNAGCVGTARAEAADIALARSPAPFHRTWIANTDADCKVPRTWLTDQLTLAQHGTEAIAGIVDVDQFHDHSPHVGERFRSTYLLNPDGTHPHVHGANLGVRADVYLRAGGWGHLPTAEDHDLWGRLLKTNARRASVAALKVITSGRRIGRAPLGFAGALAAHNDPAHLTEAML